MPLYSESKLEEELRIQQQSVQLLGAKALVLAMEATVTALEQLIGYLKDGLVPREDKLKQIQYAVDKVLPNLPEGLVRQNYEEVLQRFLDETKSKI